MLTIQFNTQDQNKKSSRTLPKEYQKYAQAAAVCIHLDHDGKCQGRALVREKV